MKLEDIFIVADDLTGAIDAGACFLKNYNNINVFTGPDYFKKENGLNILNTNTRSLGPDQAYKIIKRVFKKNTSKIVFKKIDSGIRGNVSIEIKAVDDVLKPESIIIIPAIPDLNRVTIDGHQYAGTRSIEKIFGNGPVNNIETSFIPDIIRTYLKDDIQVVDLKQARNKDYRISSKIVVFDSESNKDIDLILENLVLDRKILFVGSLGLLCGLTKYLNIVKSKKNNKQEKQEKILFICGSKDKRSIEQIKYAKNNNIISTINLDFKKSIMDLFNENLNLLNLNKNILISTENCKGISSENIQRYLTDFTELVFKKIGQETLSVFGGDTLFNICNMLKIKKLKVRDKISPAVEISQADSKFGDLIVVSKGGSVGEFTVIEKIINYFKNS